MASNIFGIAVSVGIWLLMNGVGVIWAYYDVNAWVRPDAHRSIVDNTAGWHAFTTFFIFYTIFLTLFNWYCLWYAVAAIYSFLFEHQYYVPVCDKVVAESFVSETSTIRSSIYEKDFEKYDAEKASIKPLVVKKAVPRRRNRFAPTIEKVIKIVLIIIVYIVTIFLALGPIVAPHAAIPIVWKQQFRHICDGFNVRVNLDSSTMLAGATVSFQQLSPPDRFTMTMSPNPSSSNLMYNIFSLDPGYIAGSRQFLPTYDAVHYNFTSNNYTLKLNGASVHSGRFTTAPVFCLPDLNFTAESSAFLKNEIYTPFLVGYKGSDSYLSQPHAWADNTDVMLRTAKFSGGGLLQVCARGAKDAMEGLGDKLPVAIGLIMLLRGRHQIAMPMTGGGVD